MFESDETVRKLEEQVQPKNGEENPANPIDLHHFPLSASLELSNSAAPELSIRENVRSKNHLSFR